MNAETRSEVAVVYQALSNPAMQDKFRAVLPPDVSLDRFTRVTLTAIQQKPEILECSRDSLYNACINAAQRGLLPDGKEGALVAFNTKQGNEWVKKAQFMPMPEGIIKEMAKAGIKVYAVSVYANDKIEIWNDDDGQHVSHKPVVFGDRGARVGAFACAKDADGRTFVEAMDMAELERIKGKSRSKDKAGNVVGPWVSDVEKMEQKTCLHRVRKRVAILGNDEVLDRLRDDDDNTDIDGAAEVVAPVKPLDKPAPASAAVKRPKGLQAVIDMTVQAEPPPTNNYDLSDDSDDADRF